MQTQTICRQLRLALFLVGGFPYLLSANLVTNGGFEAGNLSGWAVGNQCGGGLTGTVNSGVYAYADMTPSGSICALNQSIATTPGLTYTFSYALSHPISNGTFHSEFGFSVPEALAAGSTFSFTTRSFDLVATSSTTNIQFVFSSGGAGTFSAWSLDDVSVTTAGGVPEPSTFGLGLAGMGFLTGWQARRRRAGAKGFRP